MLECRETALSYIGRTGKKYTILKQLANIYPSINLIITVNFLISLLGIYPAENVSLASKNTWSKMFLETFVRTKNWRPLQYSPVGEQYKIMI